MKTHSTAEAQPTQRLRQPAAAERTEAAPADSFSHGPRAAAQRAMADAIHHSPRVAEQGRAVALLRNAPAGVAQLRRPSGTWGPAVQLQVGGPTMDSAPAVVQREAEATTSPDPVELEPGLAADTPAAAEPAEASAGVEVEAAESAPPQDLITAPEDDGRMPAEGAAEEGGDMEAALPFQAYRGSGPALAAADQVGGGPIGPTGMPAAMQAKMENAFGTDFSAVRVHTGSPLATGLGALAATHGNDIHFAPGTYQPNTAGGQQLLGHELAHVVQQRAGRVKSLQRKDDGNSGITLNVDRALEAEADEMGRRAAHGERAAMAGGGTSSARADVLQPMLGFEIEMLVLIDDGGRPIPEKTIVGQVGAHLNIDVDHGPAVAAATPTLAAEGRYDVDTVSPGAQIEMRRHGGPADPRPALQELALATWTATTNVAAHAEFTRPASTVHPHVNNASLALIDAALISYDFNHKNWEPGRASADLAIILAQTQAWINANTNKPNKVFHPHRRARWRRVRNAVRDLSARALLHNIFWNDPLNANAPLNLRREFRPTAPLAPWAPYQPDAGMGTDHYASIVEIVTNAYPPETPAGRTNIVQAMVDAVQFAQDIETAAGANATTRVALNTIPNTGGVAGTIHIGNPTQPTQTTEGSIQATGAIDLAQFPSYVLNMTGRNPQDNNVLTNQEFNLKHHSDTDDTEGDRVRAELPLAVANATAAVGAIKNMGSPDMQNLRGLVVLICQYLRMGKHFFGHAGQPLDKNIVPFLSRTDLSQMYARLVPDNEKTWLAGGGRMAALQAQILVQTGRNGASEVFNDVAESNPGGGIDCQTFINNVFTAGADGITANLGGFRQLPTEDVDPLNARGIDSRSGAPHPNTGLIAPHREGFVFEMRNMASRQSFGGGRFPKTKWIKLAEQQVAVFEALNARTEASATQDQRVRHAGYGAVNGPNRLQTVQHTDGAW